MDRNGTSTQVGPGAAWRDRDPIAVGKSHYETDLFHGTRQHHEVRISAIE